MLRGDKLSASAQDQLRKWGGRGGLGGWQERAGIKNSKASWGQKLLTGLLRRRGEKEELRQGEKMGMEKNGRETHTPQKGGGGGGDPAKQNIGESFSPLPSKNIVF